MPQRISRADYTDFYEILFTSLREAYGERDPDVQTAIVGFDVGGPVSLATFGSASRPAFVTYVTCELAVREDQVPSDIGRFELLLTTEDAGWARDVANCIAEMSLETMFGQGHTVDVGPVVGDEHPLQGLFFDVASLFEYRGLPYVVFRLVGILRVELEWAQTHGVHALKQRLQVAGVYPSSIAQRASAV